MWEGWCVWSLFCDVVLSGNSIFQSSLLVDICALIVFLLLFLFLALPWDGLWSVLGTYLVIVTCVLSYT